MYSFKRPTIHPPSFNRTIEKVATNDGQYFEKHVLITLFHNKHSFSQNRIL